VGIERAVDLEHVDGADLRVPLPDLVVVGVMRGRDLDTARTELGFGPLVRDQRDLAIQQRQANLATRLRHLGELLEARQDVLHPRFEALELVLDAFLLLGGRLAQAFARLGDQRLELLGRRRVHGHGRIAEHRLGARRRDHDVLRLARLWVDQRIAQVPEAALHGLVLDLVIGDRRLQLAVPVDEAIAAVDQPVFEHPEEGLAHRRRADRIHREALPIPVAGAAHALLLAHDALLILLLPLPDALDEGLAADVVAGLAFEVEEPRLHHRLRGDAGVVRARHPQRGVALHAMPADQQILQHVVHRVAHVQRARDVGQRHHDHVGLALGVGMGRKGPLRQPALLHRALDFGGLVARGKFAAHGSVLALEGSFEKRAKDSPRASRASQARGAGKARADLGKRRHYALRTALRAVRPRRGIR
jgi:hypothetical protein